MNLHRDVVETVKHTDCSDLPNFIISIYRSTTNVRSFDLGRTNLPTPPLIVLIRHRHRSRPSHRFLTQPAQLNGKYVVIVVLDV